LPNGPHIRSSILLLAALAPAACSSASHRSDAHEPDTARSAQPHQQYLSECSDLREEVDTPLGYVRTLLRAFRHIDRASAWEDSTLAINQLFANARPDTVDDVAISRLKVLAGQLVYYQTKATREYICAQRAMVTFAASSSPLLNEEARLAAFVFSQYVEAARADSARYRDPERHSKQLTDSVADIRLEAEARDQRLTLVSISILAALSGAQSPSGPWGDSLVINESDRDAIITELNEPTPTDIGIGQHPVLRTTRQVMVDALRKHPQTGRAWRMAPEG
jgi:hypothetical protein